MQSNIFEQLGETPVEGKIRSFTARELRAINNALVRYGYRPELSHYPKVNFVSKDTGARLSVHIDELLATYDTDRKENARERARQRREEHVR